MGIVNVTPDSFYSASRQTECRKFLGYIEKMLEDGADIIDIGACSTRPGLTPCSEDEELRRLRPALESLQKSGLSPIMSVDTFRSSVARMAVEEFGVSIVNDVSGGELDEDMFSLVARLKVPYVLTHPGTHFSTSYNRSSAKQGSESVICEVSRYLSMRKKELNGMGVPDVVVDPGIGFGKTLEENFSIIRDLPMIKIATEAPVLIGVSRKSMITNVLNINASEALNGTTVVNVVSLIKGADILRVHDVREAREAVELVNRLN